MGMKAHYLVGYAVRRELLGISQPFHHETIERLFEGKGSRKDVELAAELCHAAGLYQLERQLRNTLRPGVDLEHRAEEEQLQREIARLADLYQDGHLMMRADLSRLVALAADEIEQHRAASSLANAHSSDQGELL